MERDVKSVNFKNIVNLFIKENKWIIIASVVLLIWKFFLIYTLWNNRIIPPSPDDSYVYITHIESVIECPSIFFCKNLFFQAHSYTAYSHLVYRIFFGYIAILFHLDARSAYYLSFYLGAIMLIPVLILFLKSLNLNKNLIAFSIFFALLPHGLSGVHSYAWITPAYFSLLFFMLISSFVIGNYKNWKLHLIILIPLSLFTHTITLYLMFIFPLYFAINYLLTKKINQLLFKKILFASFITALFWAPFSFAMFSYSPKGDIYGIVNFLSKSIRHNSSAIKQQIAEKNDTLKNYYPDNSFKAKQIIDNKIGIFPGYKQIKYNYLQIFILNPLGFLATLIFALVLLHFKKLEILTLYFSALVFTLITSINEFGFRSLLVLWPITFVFYATGFWYLLKFIDLIKNKVKLYYIVKSVIIANIALFFVLNIAFSYLYNDFVSKASNFNINSDYIIYLKENIRPGDYAYYCNVESSRLLRFFESSLGIKTGAKITNNITDAKYYACIKNINNEEAYNNSLVNKYIDFLYQKIGVSRNKFATIQENKASDMPDIFLNKKEFGDVIVGLK